ncbi:MAG TPA: alpha-glucosidase C-terminal domain-containing protein, partial [Terriglobales bacterium]|nr:alpha-glucosidase C-terminal domain-containing protein [Terriglobales bacterium]
PMQWNDNNNAGFSQADPWLPVPPSFKTHNVETELKDPDSILQFYKHLLALRHRDLSLREGEYIPLNEDQPNVVSYLRRYKNHAVLVVLNMSGKEQKVSFDLGKQGFSGGKANTLLTTLRAHPEEVPLSDISLEPFAVYIAKVAK